MPSMTNIVRGDTAPGTPIEDLQRDAMFSTVHGARRVMSRTAAAGKRNRRTGKQLSRGAVSQGMMHEWVREKGVILRGGGTDESPHVYRRLPDVLAAQQDTIEVLLTLRPLVVVMAGRSVRSLQGLTWTSFTKQTSTAWEGHAEPIAHALTVARGSAQ